MLRQRTLACVESSPLVSSDVIHNSNESLQNSQNNLVKEPVQPKSTSKTLFVSALILLTLLSFATRFYCISEGKTVIWDEAHFGKFASHYLKREFYTDVHPPLGKMLVALGGYLNNYNGTFEFGSGTLYPDWVNFVGMRMFLASFGALAVPFAFLTAVAMDMSTASCALVAACMLFENGLIGISRLILLDSMLLCFTVTSTFGLALFNRFRDRPFTAPWYLSLCWTGLNIGLVSSVKWVGLFGVALVGLHTIRDLWMNLPVKPLRYSLKDFSARALFLIVLPLAVYIGSFYVHFAILNHSGPGDAQMSSLFQAGLIGSDISKSPFEVAFGSQVTLRNRGHGGPLLHSHVQTYPEGSKQQQVTGYHHKDVNNDFVISYPHGHPEEEEAPLEFLKDGDTIRLLHVGTNKNLHSHRVPAHVTKQDLEVSCYGNNTDFYDINDHWRVEVVADESSVENPESRIRALVSAFRLRHVATGCLLASPGTGYPDWGFKQMEITCHQHNTTSSHVLWNVETHVNDKLPPCAPGTYRSSFLRDLVDVNLNMWRTNSALIPDAELEPSALTSSAYQWPLMLTGIRMTSFDDAMVKFYMGGNPFVFWFSAASLFAVGGVFAALAMIQKRNLSISPFPHTSLTVFKDQLSISVLGWFLHHIPFYIMGRVLYFHHYYPALFFAILVLGSILDLVLTGKRSSRLVIYTVLLLIILVTFTLFMPICYGIHGPSSSIDHLRWLSVWPL